LHNSRLLGYVWPYEALQKKVKAGFAMTGEITLHGKILRTHGIKEKVLLAKREKIPNLILPI
jgi:ATP-dependent Lon protease